jgi:glycosyltransferase involved in cell wall biosynthesis
MRAWGPFYRQDAILEGFAVARRGISAPAFLVFKVFNRGSSPAENQRYRLEIERRARELDVLDAIRWIDDVPEERMPELYSLADVIVNFPRADAFPVTFLEAGASCAPVVSCRLPAYRGTFAEQYFELVEDGDIDALGRAMAKTANEGPEARADRMSELRAVVRARYDTAVCTARLMDVYRCAARRPERLATGVEGGRVEG